MRGSKYSQTICYHGFTGWIAFYAFGAYWSLEMICEAAIACMDQESSIFFLFLFFDLVIFGMNEGKNGFDTL